MLKQRKLCVLPILILFLSSCAASYQNRIVQSPLSKLDRAKGVFISTPKNGRYDRTEYKNSGQMTASAVKAAFARFSNNTFVSDECLGRVCLKIMPTEQYGYYLKPEILHWEDRATEWSGLRDRIEIKISIYEAKSGNEIASSVLTGTSKWATFGAIIHKTYYPSHSTAVEPYFDI
jgi:hypothetical protein